MTTNGASTLEEVKKQDEGFTVADRMARIPTSPHTVVIIFFVLMGWFAETIDLGGTSFLMPTIRSYFEMDATTGGYYSSACFLGMFIGIIKVCPESPLWLEAKGRYDEANAICTKIEEEAIARHKSLPEPVHIVRSEKKSSFKDLFSKKYLKVTILCFFIWFISMFSDYGLTTWLTTILMEKGFDVVQSTGFVTIGILGGIPAWFFATWSAKKFGRKKTFLIAGLCTSIFGIAYGASSTLIVLIITGILYQFGKYLNAMMLALYTPELYETSIRTTGNGLATSWGRLGSILGPIILAGVMTSFGAYTTMYIAAAMVIIPGLLVFLFGPETKGEEF